MKLKSMKRVIALGLAMMMAVAVVPASSVSAKTKYKTVKEDGKEYIVFGSYEQDGDESNGKEPIEWEVLRKDKKGILVVSRYVLDAKAYHDDEFEDATWESSTLRAWMNDDFYNAAFNNKEKKKIKTMTIKNEDNAYYKVDGGKNTKDKIFCLSVSEILKCFTFTDKSSDLCLYCEELITMPTEYAQLNGAKVGYEITEDTYNSYYQPKYGYSEECIGKAGCYWWLRTIGSNNKIACRVQYDGATGEGYNGWCYETFHGVRPAMYLKK